MKPADLPPEIFDALEADDAGPLHEIVRRRREEDFQRFRRILASSDAPERWRIRSMYALARWGDPSVAPEIERVMPELSERGRIAGIDALGRLRAEVAIDTIVAHATHPSAHVRKTVAHALSRIGTARADEELRAMAEKDPTDWVRGVARKQLAIKAR